MALTPALTKHLNNPELFLDLAAEANPSTATTRSASPPSRRNAGIFWRKSARRQFGSKPN